LSESFQLKPPDALFTQHYAGRIRDQWLSIVPAGNMLEAFNRYWLWFMVLDDQIQRHWNVTSTAAWDVHFSSAREGSLSAECYAVPKVRPAEIIKDNGQSSGVRLAATVWKRNRIVRGGKSLIVAFVQQELSKMMTEFTADYYKQNDE
jgi:hypothetical protein